MKFLEVIFTRSWCRLLNRINIIVYGGMYRTCTVYKPVKPDFVDNQDKSLSSTKWQIMEYPACQQGLSALC